MGSIIAEVKEVLPSKEVEYTNYQGQKQAARVLPVLLKYFTGEVYCEAFGGVAEDCERMNLMPGDMVHADLDYRVREFQRQDGTRGFETKANIAHLSVIRKVVKSF